MSIQQPPIIQLKKPFPQTALAPMQDVTSLPFMRVINHFGPPDLFFTEYFRVHAHSKLEPHILAAIEQNPFNRPIFAQLIGEHIPDMLRTVDQLYAYPIAGIDINMGCPAPRVYKKNVGGGLLREIDRIDQLLQALRQHIPGLLTVKMRIGFDDSTRFSDLLACVKKNRIDLLSVHGRTVKQSYRGDVDYDAIAQAVQTMDCPVLANGNITSPQKAKWVLEHTQAAGVMIGRSAIRNPWIFKQIQQLLNHQPIFEPTLKDVRVYIERLHEALKDPTRTDEAHVSRLKKFLNFIGQSVDSTGSFLHDIRRAPSLKELFMILDRHLLTQPDMPFALEPYEGVIARPNCEASSCDG